MGTHPIFESDFDCLTDGNMNRSLDRSIDRSMDEKLYSLIEANVQITNETIAELEGENEQFRNQVNTLKDKNAAINELLKQTRADNERLVARVNAQIQWVTMIPLIIM